MISHPYACPHPPLLQPLPSLSRIAEDYDAFIIDLWGVIHDGTALYEGARQALVTLKTQGKRIVLLSNAPRQSALAVATLTRLSIGADLYDHILTSGQAAHDLLIGSAEWDASYYYLGPSKDERIIDDLPYLSTDDLNKARWVLCTGFEYDYQPEAEIEPLLARLIHHALPMLCINPDLEVIKQDGTRLLCAGWVAARYEALGGTVTYIGKPHPLVYQRSLALLDHPSRVLAIGDNLLTDIRGANRAGLDSLLITGGILTTEQGTQPNADTIAELCQLHGSTPTYVCPAFRF